MRNIALSAEQKSKNKFIFVFLGGKSALSGSNFAPFYRSNALCKERSLGQIAACMGNICIMVIFEEEKAWKKDLWIPIQSMYRF